MNPLKVQYIKHPVLEPTPDTCPAGYRYRKPYFVAGSCVRSGENDMSDKRCPSGMHWRNTFEVKAGCVRLPTQKRLKKNKEALQQAEVQLPTCSEDLVSPLFTDHIKLILSNLEEHFTVPVSTEKLERQSHVFTKIKRRFIKSIQDKLKDKRCEFRPSKLQIVQIENIIRSVVQVFNSRFLTPEKWNIVARAAELNLLLFVSRQMVAKTSQEITDLTVFYVEQLRELRRLLQYMDSEQLLPRQNMAVALAWYNYLNKFFADVPNMHNVPNVRGPYLNNEKIQSLKKAENKVLVEGYVQLRGMTPEEAAQLRTDIPNFEPVDLPEEKTLLEAAPIIEMIPTLGDFPSTPVSTIVARPVVIRSLDTTPAEPFTEQMMNELYDLYIIFETFNQKSNAQLNVRGEQLYARYDYLFNELARYQNYQNSEQQLLAYINNYGKSQVDPNGSVTISSLNAKYMGPFWTERGVTIHCPYCNQLLKLSRYVPYDVFECPSCGNNIKVK